MRIEAAFQLSELRVQQAPVRREFRSAASIASEIWAEARERGLGGSLGGCTNVQDWQQKWLPSKRFHLMRVPLNAAALACAPREMNLVLKKIYAQEQKPIVIDYNRNRVGASTVGYVPDVVVVDGKHRFASAGMRGNTDILAWIGEEAIELIPSLQAFGGGGGPAPERTTPASGSSLVAKRRMKAGEYNPPPMGPRQMPPPSMRGNARMKKLLARTLRINHLDVKNRFKEFKADCKAGRYKPEINAVSPPGWSGTVEKMKEDHPNIDNPFALAWYMHKKGDRPHVAPTKSGKS